MTTTSALSENLVKYGPMDKRISMMAESKPLGINFVQPNRALGSHTTALPWPFGVLRVAAMYYVQMLASSALAAADRVPGGPRCTSTRAGRMGDRC